ncbi:MAG: sulfotransferase [Acidimicrobiales bacterium]|nr:sulfotransferase domain-containing protein [Acidimicrobiales bacterium]
MTSTVVEQPIVNPSLEWIIDILRGHDANVVTTRGKCPDDHVELDRFTVYPSVNQPRMLISGASRVVRGAVLRRAATRSGGHSLGSIARYLGASAAHLGIDHLALGPDIVFSAPMDEAAERSSYREPRTLTEYLESAIDDHELCLAVNLGPLRPNRKPVLQLMDRSGSLVAYAKIGWDESTRRMVESEAGQLEKFDGRLFRNLLVPKLLHFGRWREMSILITAPLVDDGPIDMPPRMVLEALAEVASLTEQSRVPLAEADWTLRQLARVEALGPAGAELGEALTRCLSSHGDRPVTFGSSHGDWSPWNMRRMGRRVGVWDWERAADDVPIGLDLVHYHFQRSFHSSGKSVASGLDNVQQTVPSELARLGVDGDEHDLITVLYLIELALRFAESSLRDDAELVRTYKELIVELRHHIPRIGEKTEDRRSERHDPPVADKPRLFTRRMLGGSGVPTPARDAIKKAAKGYGRATSSYRVLPNTYIVGAQRCGTTSLFRYLTQHRSVVGPMLEKGVHFYDTNYTGDLDWYRSHFPTQARLKLSRQLNGCDMRTVEASPYYLFHPFVPERIHAATPDAKILVLVRDPVERALSHHNHEVKRGFETEDFASALDLEARRLAGEVDLMAADPLYVSYAHQHYSYAARGRYMEQISRYDELFGKSNVMVIRTIDLEANPAQVVDEVLRFLGVALMGSISFPRYNARRYPSMDESLRLRLREEFAASDAALAQRIGRDADSLWD